MVATWGPRLVGDGHVYRKTAAMHARRVSAPGALQTVVAGEIETEREYGKDEVIIIGTEGERYAIPNELFESRYETAAAAPARTAELAAEGFELFKPTGRVWALELAPSARAAELPAGAFVARWGEPMAVRAGDFLAAPFPSGGELYRIDRGAFEHTYTRDDAALDAADETCAARRLLAIAVRLPERRALASARAEVARQLAAWG